MKTYKKAYRIRINLEKKTMIQVKAKKENVRMKEELRCDERVYDGTV